MTTPDTRERTPLWAAVAAAGAFVICCAGPALLALLSTTGLGVILARRGAFAVEAGLVAALAILAVIWQRRRAAACRLPRPTASRPETSAIRRSRWSA